jgi:hypothetical protein
VICSGIRSIRYFVLLPALLIGPTSLARAQRSIGNITVGYTYLWADQGSGERSNLNGFFMRPAFNIGKGFSVFFDSTNYYGSNHRGSLNSHGYTGGIDKQVFARASLRIRAFVEGGNIRLSNAGNITNSPAFLTGFGVGIPIHGHWSLALTPAEYALIDSARGVRNDFNAKVGLSLSF